MDYTKTQKVSAKYTVYVAAVKRKYEGRSINKLQNGIILLIFKI